MRFFYEKDNNQFLISTREYQAKQSFIAKYGFVILLALLFTPMFGIFAWGYISGRSDFTMSLILTIFFGMFWGLFVYLMLNSLKNYTEITVSGEGLKVDMLQWPASVVTNTYSWEQFLKMKFYIYRGKTTSMGVYLFRESLKEKDVKDIRFAIPSWFYKDYKKALESAVQKFHPEKLQDK